MNAEQLNERFLELTKLEEQARSDFKAAESRLIAIDGAKQDVQFWLHKLAAEAQAKIGESETVNPVPANDDFVPMQETAPTTEGV